MPIEIVPKKKHKIPPWILIFLIICGILLAGFGGSYFYISVTKSKVSQAIEEKNRELVKTQEERALEQKMLGVEKKINDFAKLLAVHKKVINVFDFIEKMTHPQVWFTSVDLSVPDNKIVMGGLAKNLDSFEQQRLALLDLVKENPFLKSINVAGIALTETREVKFSLDLILDPSIFK